jgi:glycosyltransferase involved in cell wall biosynthesis
VIAVSRAVAAALHKQGIDPGKVVTIPNGIDTTRFAKKPAHQNGPLNLYKSGTQFLVGMVGHLAPIKGQEDFVRAAAIIASQREDVDFVLAGDDKSRSGENRRAIENLIAQLSLGKRVQLVGWLDDVRGLLRALDVFVSPSRSEPFGLAVIEAMASGVPVVASMSEGSREIINDGVTGRLVAIKDVEGLAKAIVDLLTNEPERKKLSVNALGLVQQRFSLQRMVEDTEQLYWDVLDNSKRLKT